MDALDNLRAVLREIAGDGETDAIRGAAAAALDEPEFAALPSLGRIIGSSRFAGALAAAVTDAWNVGD